MFPTLSQYNRVIQQQGSGDFRTLNNIFFIPARTSPIKIYNFGSGSFAVVFKALENNKEIAIRCFIGSDNDYVERYRKIDNYLRNIDESWKVNIQFLDNEIKVDGKYYPVLKMDWVDGVLLNKYIDNNLYNNDVLSKLQKQFVKISTNLEDNKIAHGDIQCGNIIVKEINGKPIIKLIDYDGLYIPFLSGEEQKERGRSEFQHPNRSYFGFNEKIDRFSFWVILCALEALKFDKSLWKETMQGGFNTLDNMLFVGSDFSNPTYSKLFQRISNLNQPSLNFYIAKLQVSLNTSNTEKLHYFDQKKSLNETDDNDSHDFNDTDNSITSIKESNTNQFARLKITSSPSGASIRNKDFEKIGITPLTVNKYKYINQEIKIISGTKSKSRTIDESSSDIHINFEEPVYKRPVVVTPVSPPNIPFTPPSSKNKNSDGWLAFTLVVILIIGAIIYGQISKKSIDSDTDYPYVDSTAVVVDTAAVFVDSAAVAIDSAAVAADTTAYGMEDTDTEPTVLESDYSNDNKIDVASNLYRSYFLGTWSDENSTFTFYDSGNYYIKFDDGSEKWYNWEYTNGKLYLNYGQGNLDRVYVLSSESNSFTYSENGAKTVWNASRIGN